MTAPSPHTHPAERETPAGEAMREAVAQWLRDRFPLNTWQSTAQAIALLKSGPIASELARLTAERDEARADQRAMLIQVGEHARARGEAEGALAISEKAGIVEGWRDRATAAEAALTTQRADHAAEMARKDAEIADLRGALEDTKAAADDLAQACLDEHDNKAAGALQFISGFISDRFDALATTETTDA